VEDSQADKSAADKMPADDIDIDVAHTARVYDYLLGGTDHFEVDREVAEHAFSAWPGGVDGARADARANRSFLGRVVRYLAAEAGLRQFLDIGPGIPNADNTHAVAQDLAPESRVVYVDNDPIVLAHAHDMLVGGPQGRTDYIQGDLRDPGKILDKAAVTLDLDRPVGVVLIGVLHVVPDHGQPYDAVHRLMSGVAPGSHLAISHIVMDDQKPEMFAVSARLHAAMHATNPPAFRTWAQIHRFFDGLELVEPGLVPIRRWRPDPAETGYESLRLGRVYGGIGRKP
jgi:hypothetical protein